MGIVVFDTLSYANKLKSAGFSDKQAEAQAEIQKELLSEILDTSLANKTDIKNIELKSTEIQKEIIGIRKEIAEIKEFEVNLQKEIKQIEANLQKDIAEIRKDIAEIRIELATIKSDTLKWTAGMLLVQSGIIIGGIIAVIKFLIK